MRVYDHDRLSPSSSQSNYSVGMELYSFLSHRVRPLNYFHGGIHVFVRGSTFLVYLIVSHV